MWKKLLIKVISAGVVMTGLSMYAGYLTTGQLPPFIARLRQFSAAESDSSPASGWANIGALNKKSTAAADRYEVLQGGRTTIYKWRDAKGVWQYSERAPLNGTPAIRMEVMTAVSAPGAELPAADSPVKPTQPGMVKENTPGLVNPYSADGVKQIMEKAKEAQQLMNEHTRKQEQL